MTNYFGWKGKSPKLEHFLGQENLKIRRWRTGQKQGHEWEFGRGDSHSKKTEAESHWWPSVGWTGEERNVRWPAGQLVASCNCSGGWQG